MSFLLLPEDERELVAYLVETRGLRLLVGDVLQRDVSGRRRPRVSVDALAAIPRVLPGPPAPGDTEVRQFLFWPPDVGGLVALGDPGRGQDPRSRVGIALSMQGNVQRWRDVVDQDRSPLIRWRRCYWRTNGHLTPGLLQGMAEVTRLWPSELLRLHSSIDRWLRKGSSRLDPFDYCDNPPVAPPANRSRFVVWARPEAMAWVREGGRIWPWTA